MLIAGVQRSREKPTNGSLLYRACLKGVHVLMRGSGQGEGAQASV